MGRLVDFCAFTMIVEMKVQRRHKKMYGLLDNDLKVTQYMSSCYHNILVLIAMINKTYN